MAGRLIYDNILMAYDILHSMSTKIKGIEGYIAFKLDMSKEYDRMEWPFIAVVLQKMSFHSKWITSVMMCLQSFHIQFW